MERTISTEATTQTPAPGDAAPADLQAVPATVGALTLDWMPVDASVDATALLLGPEGSAMPLQAHDAEHDGRSREDPRSD